MQPASRPGRERPPYHWPKAAEPVPAALFAMPGLAPGSIFPQSQTLPAIHSWPDLDIAMKGQAPSLSCHVQMTICAFGRGYDRPHRSP